MLRERREPRDPQVRRTEAAQVRPAQVKRAGLAPAQTVRQRTGHAPRGNTSLRMRALPLSIGEVSKFWFEGEDES